MGEFVVVFLIMAGIAVAIAGKIREALREEAERARKLAEKQRAGPAEGEPAHQEKPELQTLLEVLARKAEARGAHVEEPPVQGPRAAEPQDFKVVPPPPPQVRVEPQEPRVPMKALEPVQDPYRVDAVSPGVVPGAGPSLRARREKKGGGKHRPKGARQAADPSLEAAWDVPGAGTAYAQGVSATGGRVSERLVRVLQGRRFWQQAVVLREMLGAPRSERPYGRDDTYNIQ